MAPPSNRSRGRRSNKSNSPSSVSSASNMQIDAQASTGLSAFPFTFEYSIHSATTSFRIEADVCRHPRPLCLVGLIFIDPIGTAVDVRDQPVRP